MGDFITMKFTKHTFLMLGLASVFSIAWIGDGMAKRWDCTSKPSAGQYCKNSGNHQICPFGCYCPGGEKRALGDDYDANSFCSDSSKGNQWPYQDSGIYHCPSSHPKSLGSQTSISGCYYEAQNNDGTIKVYYNEEKNIEEGYYLPSNTWNPVKKCKDGYYCPGGKFVASRTNDVGLKKCTGEMNPNDAQTKCVITCPVGKYLKKNTETCSNCPDDQYCPGGGPWEKKNSDQGLGTCPEGKVPNDNGTSCEIQANCTVGTYLPKNSETCAECPDGNTVCKGGKFGVAAIDQGLTECGKAPYPNSIPNASKTDCVACPAGKEPDENHANCVDKRMFIMPGKYLPANATEPGVDCLGTKKYCPGGKFYKKSVEQGRYDCPFNADASEDHKSCKLKLTAKQLEQGSTASGQCWKKTDPEDYKYCIYGVRFLDEEDMYAELANQTALDKQACESLGNGCAWTDTGCVCYSAEDTTDNAEDTTDSNANTSNSNNDNTVYFMKTAEGVFAPVNGRPDDLCGGGYWSYSEEHGYIQVKCWRRR